MVLKYLALLVLPLAFASCKAVPEERKSVDTPPTVKLASLAPSAGMPIKTLPKRQSTELGLLLGTWADPEINASMGNLDRLKNQQAEKRATNAPSGQLVTWASPSTGNSGTIVALRDAYDANGSFCREFRQTVTLDGKQKQGTSFACQQQDGSWKTTQAYAGS